MSALGSWKLWRACDVECLASHCEEARLPSHRCCWWTSTRQQGLGGTPGRLCSHTFSGVGLENSHSGNLPPPPSRGTVSSPGFPLHPASEEHTTWASRASRVSLIVLGPFYFKDLNVLFGGLLSLSCSGRSSQLHRTGQGMALNSLRLKELYL